MRPAIVGFGCLTLLTGVVFPLALYGIARATFPNQAAGSLMRGQGGVVIGSELIGQAFTRPEYFHPRPSAAGAGYDATASGGSNLAPSNAKLVAAIAAAAGSYRLENGLSADAEVPIEAVTSSGSGLDPHISPRDAALQAPRVARARRLDAREVQALVAANTRGRDLAILGEPRVNVLELNLALDHARRHRAP